jgi:hypothetical protein
MVRVKVKVMVMQVKGNQWWRPKTTPIEQRLPILCAILKERAGYLPTDSYEPLRV